MLLKDSSKLTALEGIHELHDRMKEIIQTENAKRKKVKKKKKPPKTPSKSCGTIVNSITYM